jgi:type II secretory pathway component PulM
MTLILKESPLAVDPVFIQITLQAVKFQAGLPWLAAVARFGPIFFSRRG